MGVKMKIKVSGLEPKAKLTSLPVSERTVWVIK